MLFILFKYFAYILPGNTGYFAVYFRILSLLFLRIVSLTIFKKPYNVTNITYSSSNLFLFSFTSPKDVGKKFQFLFICFKNNYYCSKSKYLVNIFFQYFHNKFPKVKEGIILRCYLRISMSH